MLPPVAAADGEAGYVTRTEGKIEVEADAIESTMLPQLTKRRVENVQILERFPTNVAADQTIVYSDKRTVALGAPSDFTFDVVVDVGKAESNTRATYRVMPAHNLVTGRDTYAADADGNIIGRFPDGKPDDFFTDQDGNGSISTSVIGEQFDDSAGPDGESPDGKLTNWDRYYDLNGNGYIDMGLSSWLQETYPDGPVWGPGVSSLYDHLGVRTTWSADGPEGHREGQPFLDERYIDVNGDGVIGGWVDVNGTMYWRTSAPVIDSDDDGVGDRSETTYPNYRYNYAPDGSFDFPSFETFNGGLYLVSMLTGTRESNRITFAKVKDGSGALVDAPGAKIATLPFVESATINTEAYTADGTMSISFESTVFGRVDVDVCRTDLVAWKVALDRGFIANRTQATQFTAEYAVASQHGGVFLEEKSVVTSIQAGSPTVRRTIESVFTTEPPAAADPDPPDLG